MLGRDVLVTASLGALARVTNDREQGIRGLRATGGCALRTRERHEGIAGARANRTHVCPNGLEQGERDAFALFDQRFKQVDGLHLRVTGCTGSLERRGDGLLRLCRHFTCHEILLQMVCLVASSHSTPSDRHNEARVESIPLNFSFEEDVSQFSGSQVGPSNPR